jgi:hypothetical protein
MLRRVAPDVDHPVDAELVDAHAELSLTSSIECMSLSAISGV